MLVVGSGQALAQLIALALTPLITRLYGPEAFGTLGAFLALTSVAVPLTVLGYSIAIVLPRNDEDALGLIRLCALIGIVMAFSMTILFLSFEELFGLLIAVQPERIYILIFGATAFFAAWVQVAQQWLIRKKRFDAIARAAVAHAVITYGFMVLVGLEYPLAPVLVSIAAAGFAAHGTFLTVASVRLHRVCEPVPQVARKALRKISQDYYDFPLFRAPQLVINAISQGLPVLMLAALSGSAVAGYYALARVAIGAPVNLVAKSVGEVIYPKITETAYAGQELWQPLLRMTAILAAIALIPFGILIVLGPPIFGFIFGEEWIRAGDYAQWLSVFFFMGLINKPCVAAVPVLRLQKGLLAYEIISISVKAAGLWLGVAWFQSDLLGVALFSILGALSYLILIGWIIHQASILGRKQVRAN
jgi:O-antigen/teichoic acid export membrane protein